MLAQCYGPSSENKGGKEYSNDKRRDVSYCIIIR